MKRAKIILGIVAALAVIGGTLAFNVRIINYVYVATTTQLTTECTFTARGYTITPNNNATYLTLATTDFSQPCVLNTIYATF